MADKPARNATVFERETGGADTPPDLGAGRATEAKVSTTPRLVDKIPRDDTSFVREAIENSMDRYKARINDEVNKKVIIAIALLRALRSSC
jgi:hypothetical protein